MLRIPDNIRQRLLLARPTPARLTQIMEALEKAINERQENDDAVELEYTLAGEVYGEADLLPSITISLRRAVPLPPKPKLELPGP
jgi:hypothetical protein